MVDWMGKVYQDLQTLKSQLSTHAVPGQGAPLGIVFNPTVANPQVSTFEKHLKRLRYRDGKIDGYLSRLHYFSDLIKDNEQKGILKNITYQLGGITYQLNVFSMSSDTHSLLLKKYSQCVDSMKKWEKKLNQ